MIPIAPGTIGANEDEITTSAEVQQQIAYNKAATQTPIAQEPEVVDTEVPVHIPSLKLVETKKGMSDADSKAHIASYYKQSETISRQPNRWDSNGSMVINASDGVQIGWLPRVNQSSVLIYNHSTSGGTLYVAASQQKLLGSTIRGVPVAPGATFGLQTEAGGFILAPSGATIDIIWTWFEDEEARPTEGKPE